MATLSRNKSWTPGSHTSHDSGIQPSGPRTLNIKSQLRRSHNPSNCVCITPSQPNTSARRDKNFVLSLFLSNVMSLAPKIDELAHVVLNANFDLVCITKTWLQKHIPDSTVTIQGYNLIHLDRNEAYTTCVRILKCTTSLHHLDDFTDKTDGLEVLWIKVRPREYSDFILGLVYHPPAANHSIMLDYLTSCLSDIESKRPNRGIVVLGDFNQLNVSRLK